MFISHHLNVIIISLQADHIIVWKYKDSLLLNVINMKQTRLKHFSVFTFLSSCVVNSSENCHIVIIVQELKNKETKI